MLGGVADDSDESLAELGALVVAHGPLVIGQLTQLDCPPGAQFASVSDYCQMRLDTLRDCAVTDHPIEELGANDAADMLALAQLTKPGPFSLQTYKLGEYWGIRHEGTLVAMAGERLKQGNAIEVSGVCTHPDHLGKGMALALCKRLATRITDRGAQAYLHVDPKNEGAVHVYRKLGFKIRQPLAVHVIEPAGAKSNGQDGGWGSPS